MKGNIRIIKVEKKESTEIKNKDKQDGKYYSPEIPFDLLLKSYEGSFIVSGIIDKLSNACDGGFETIENKELNEMISKLNIRYLFTNFLIFGNIFLEVAKTKSGNKTILDPILTTTMRININGKYEQIVSNTIKFEKEEVIHIKRPSLRSKKYGASILENVVDQISLLRQIDTFYINYFDRGLLSPFVLTDKENKLTDAQYEDLKIMMSDGLRGQDGAFRGLVIPAELQKVELGNVVDNNAFLQLRTDLIKSICVGMNYPYGLVINDSSNRSTSETEYNNLLKEIIVPLQNEFLFQLKEGLKNCTKLDKPAIDNLFFKTVDTKNKLEEMRIITGYTNAGLLTKNEGRDMLGYDGKDGGDELETRLSPEQSKERIDEIEKKLSKIYD